MDWTKAKTILIVALLITNLFLIITYGLGQEPAEDKEDQQVFINMLEEKNIFLDTAIPQKHSKMNILSVEFSETDKELVDEEMAKLPEVNSTDKRDYEQVANQFLKNCGYMNENVQLVNIYQTQDRNPETDQVVNQTVVEYANRKDGILVEESYIRCGFEDGKMVAFQRYWLNPAGYSKKKLQTISASSALWSFMGEIPWEEPVHVKSIEMVYWLADAGYNVESTVSDMAFPAWKIVYNDGMVKHIPATDF